MVWRWVPFPVRRSMFCVPPPLPGPAPPMLGGGPRREVEIGLETRFSHTPQPPSWWRQNGEKKNEEAGIVLVKAAPR